MDNEIPFRILLLALFMAFVAHRGYYTRKLGRPDEDTLRQREETLATKLANLLSLPALIATLVYVAYPRWMAWASLPFPAWLRWLGVGVALSGFALLQWSHQALGRNWSDTPRLMKDQALVTGGPYRWVRHPIYSAFLLIMSATLVLSANAFIGVLWIGMTAVDVSSRIRIEEEMMASRFGDQYLVYMQGTGRLLPRLLRARGGRQ